MGIEYAGRYRLILIRDTLFENMVVMEVLKYRFNCGNLFRSYRAKGLNDSCGVRMGMMADYCIMTAGC